MVTMFSPDGSKPRLNVFAAIVIFSELYHILAQALHSSNLVHSFKTREVSYTRSVFVLLLIGSGKKMARDFQANHKACESYS